MPLSPGGMVTSEGAPVGQRFRHGLRTHRYALSLLVLAAGTLMTALALGNFLGPLAQSAVFRPINAVTDQSGSDGPNYNLAFAVIGPITFIVGAYLVGAYVVARRKFEHLMETRSKAEFLRNIPDLEDTLWELTPADEQRYLDRRAELKIRR
jgi:hypothetical protein